MGFSPVLPSLFFQNDSNQPRANIALKTNPNGWESSEPEFIKKNGEVTVNPAASNPTSGVK
jgi:hypothetical protein